MNRELMQRADPASGPSRYERAFTALLCGIALIAAVPQAQRQGVAFAGAETEPIKNKQTAVLAGGCFWGVDAVFKHVRGVTSVVSGYSGGDAATAHYEVVGSGVTGHAESVKIDYDPSRVSYRDLLRVFFLVAHDPTELNYQGPDRGTQYRSAIFYANDEQRRTALKYIEELNQRSAFPKRVVTEVEPLKGFYAAEEYHQNFLERNPDYPYIVVNDLPKLERLRKKFPELYMPGRQN